MTADPGDLLNDMRTLRHKARRDRQAYVFPLFLFGALILLAPLCYAEAVFTIGDPETGFYEQFDEVPFFGHHGVFLLRYPWLVGYYWLFVTIGGAFITAWWYRRHAIRTGLEVDTRSYVIGTVVALAGFTVSLTLLERVIGGLYSNPELNLPILFGSLLGAATAFFGSTRRALNPTQRNLCRFVGAVLAAVSLSAIGVYMIRGMTYLVVVAAALLILAAVERRVLLTVVSVLFAAAALLVNLYEIQNVYYQLGLWQSQEDQRWQVLQILALPASVLIIGGVIALVIQRSRGETDG